MFALSSRSRRALVATLGLVLSSRGLLAGVPEFVADLERDQRVILGSGPRNFVSVGEIAYFTTSSYGQPERLWRTDGWSVSSVDTPCSGALEQTWWYPILGSAGDAAIVTLICSGEASTSFWSLGTTENEWRRLNLLDETGAVLHPDRVSSVFQLGGRLLWTTEHWIDYRLRLWTLDAEGEDPILLQTFSPDETVPDGVVLAHVLRDGIVYAVRNDDDTELTFWYYDRATGSSSAKFASTVGSWQVEDSLVLGDSLVWLFRGPSGAILFRWDLSASGPEALVVRPWIEPFQRLEAEPVESNAIAFVATTDDYDAELWSSDGTALGTRILYFVPPTQNLAISAGAWIARGGGGYYFVTRESGTAATTLIRLDAATLGLTIVADLCPGATPDFGCFALARLQRAGQRLLFERAEEGRWWQLWSASLKTGELAKLEVPQVDLLEYLPRAVPFDGNRLVTLWGPGFKTRDVWRVRNDGLSVDLLLDDADVAPWAWEDVPDDGVVRVGDRWVFAADEGKRGSEPWSVDRSAGSAEILADLVFEVAGLPGSPEDGVIAGEDVYFSTGGHGGRAFYHARGSSDSHGYLFSAFGDTCQVVHICYYYRTGVVDGRLLLLDHYGGAIQAFDPEAGTVSTLAQFGYLFVLDRERLWADWFAVEGTNYDRDRREIWSSNAAPGGEHLLRSQAISEGDAISILGRAGSRLLIGVHESGAGFVESVSSDGAGRDTLFSGLSVGFASEMGSFSLLTGREGDLLELWRSDGTPEGTSWVAALGAASLAKAEVAGLRTFLWLWEEDESSLWISDGTTSGTVRALPLPGLGVSHFPSQIYVGAKATYLATETTEGGALVRVAPDGSGELLSTRVLAATPIAAPADFDRLVFLGESEIFGAVPWVSDGTVVGTYALTDFHRRDAAQQFRVVGGLATTVLVRAARSEFDPGELWATTGLPGGAFRLIDFDQGHQLLDLLIVDAKAAFLNVVDAEHGGELWVTDGTAEGTRLVMDLFPGPQGSAPEFIAATADYAYFLADDGVHGRELWRVGWEDSSSCRPDARTICLLQNRFRANLSWVTFGGDQFDASSASAGDELGIFGLGGVADTDVALRLRPSAEGTAVDVAIASMTNVHFFLTIADTETGALRRYENPESQFGSLSDPKAFSDATIPGSLTAVRLGSAGPGTTGVFDLLEAASGCVASATRACLLDGRFAASASRSDATGLLELAQVGPLSDGSVALTWVESEGVAAFAKLVDGGAINDRVWVFGASLESFEFEIRILDTVTGSERTYRNPEGSLMSFGDLSAF